jgi:hypothetical protein
MSAIEYRIDAMRRGMMNGVTGVYVQARDWHGNWRKVDIACLTDESLARWLDQPLPADKRGDTAAAHKLLLERNQPATLKQGERCKNG